MTAPLTSLTIDGVQHELANLPEGIQNAAGLYQTLQRQLADAQVEALKCQLAVQSVGQQITDAVRLVLAEREAAEEVSDAEVKTDSAE